MRKTRALSFLLCLVLVSSSGVVSTATRHHPSEDLEVIISRDAVEKLIVASMPYQLRLDMGLFEQVVTLTNPRDVRLVSGGIRLRVDASGSPLPLRAEITPNIRLVRDQATGDYSVVVDEMPVNMGRAGTYNLASYIPAVPIERSSHHLLGTPDVEIGVELVISAIEVTETGIVVRFATEYP